MSIRWRIHFSTSIFLAVYMLTGRFYEYAIVVVSLLVHELGHICAARLTGIQIKSVCFYLYGADIRFHPGFIPPKKQFIIACGGPIATLLLFCVCLIDQKGIFLEVMEMQLLLLLVNLCPIWPLDGGRIVQVLLIRFFQSNHLELMFLKFSFVSAVGVLLFAVLIFKPALILLAVVICLQIVNEIKHFPLNNAYKKLVLEGK